MSKEKIKLNQLEMLVAVVDMGSFNAAAIELGCTQSRISHAIGQLESNIGARLLDRSQSGCTPTTIGYSVLVKARQMLNIATSVIHSLNDSLELVGTVRIACFRSVATHILPYAIERLHEDSPGIQIEINDGCTDYTDVEKSVEEGRADIGITRGPFHQGLVSYPFICDSYVFVAPATLRLDAPVTWEQFSHLPFIQAHNAGAKWILDQCREAGFTQHVARTLVNESGILAMVKRNLGYTIFPRLTIFSESEGLKFVTLPIPVKRHLSIITNLDSNRSELTRTVIQHLRDKKTLLKTEAFRSNMIEVDF